MFLIFGWSINNKLINLFQNIQYISRAFLIIIKFINFLSFYYSLFINGQFIMQIIKLVFSEDWNNE